MPKKLILRGRVQGVCCRGYCSMYARAAGIHGAASNLPDGTVVVLLKTDSRQETEAYVNALKANPRLIRFYGNIQSISIEEYTGRIYGDYLF